MKIKETLAYEGRKPQSRYKTSLVIDTVSLDEIYLIADLYSQKTLIYRMVISQTGYMHYDYQTDKIDKKEMWNNPHRGMLKDAYVTDEDMDTLRDFCNNIQLYRELYNKNKAYDILRDLESNVSWYVEKRKCGRRNIERDELFNLMPKVPDLFLDSIEHNANKGNIIYYKRHGNYADYRCCQCGKTYSLRNKIHEGLEPVKVYPVPEKFKSMQCVECGRQAVLYQEGYAKTTHQEFFTMLYQVAADETLIARLYYTNVSRDKHGAWEVNTREKERIFLRSGKVRQYYHQYNDAWISVRQVKLSDVYTLYDFGYENIFKSCLKYMPKELYKVMENNNSDTTRINQTKWEVVESYAHCPQLETLYKVGMTYICRTLIWRGGRTRDIDKKQKELHKILRISKPQLAYLMKNPGTASFDTINMLHFADKYSVPISKYDRLKVLWDAKRENDLYYLIKFQSFDKLFNTIKRYRRSYVGMHNTIMEYADYLREREAQGYDLGNSVYLIDSYFILNPNKHYSSK